MRFRPLASAFAPLSLLCAALAQPIILERDTAAPANEHSPELVSIVFEDPSYAADADLANKEVRPPAARPETPGVSASSDFVC